MSEHIIVTKPAEKESDEHNIIRLFNGEILQAGLKKDIEPFDRYARHLESYLEMMEVNGKDKFDKDYYFMDGGIRIKYYWKNSPAELIPKPITNTEGSMHFYARAVDILHRFENKLKELFPKAEYKLIVKHNSCCVLQPRIRFKTFNIKEIKKAFPAFKADDKINETTYEPNILAPVNYEDDYSDHKYDYYDCKRCDPDPCWGRYKEVQPEQDPDDAFCEQKPPKRIRGSPRAHCIGTRTMQRPPEKELVEMGYWKLSTQELFARIENPKKDDDLELLLEERWGRIFDGRVKLILTDKPINFYELADILVPDIEAGKKLAELEKRGLIKGYSVQDGKKNNN